MKKHARFAAALLGFLAAAAPSVLGQAPPKAPKRPARAEQQREDPLAPLLKQAEEAIEKKDYSAALPPLESYLAQRPDDAYAHFQLGYAFSLLQRFDDAKAEYARAIALNPKLAAAHVNLGLILLDKDPAAAVAPFHQAAELEPEKARPRFLEGLALERSGKLPEAILKYEAAAKLDEKNFDIRFAWGRALLAADRAADAEAAFRAAIAVRADSAPAHLGLANSLLSQKKTDAAAQEFSAYLQLQPQDREARTERAGLLADLNQNDEALAELDRADAGAAPTLASLKLRAEIAVKQKKPAAAAEALKKAVELAPRDVELHARLGRTLLEAKDYPEAERELRTALVINPRWTDALRDLVALYYVSQHYAATLEALDRLAQREEPNAGTWFIRAACYDKLSRNAEAVTAYEKFLALDQGHSESQTFIAHERIRFLKLQQKKK